MKIRSVSIPRRAGCRARQPRTQITHAINVTSYELYWRELFVHLVSVPVPVQRQQAVVVRILQDFFKIEYGLCLRFWKKI